MSGNRALDVNHQQHKKSFLIETCSYENGFSLCGWLVSKLDLWNTDTDPATSLKMSSGLVTALSWLSMLVMGLDSATLDASLAGVECSLSVVLDPESPPATATVSSRIWRIFEREVGASFVPTFPSFPTRSLSESAASAASSACPLVHFFWTMVLFCWECFTYRNPSHP